MEVTEKNEGSSAANYIHNTEIYPRVVCLLSIGQVSLEDMFFYELSPVPMSMFTVTGEGRFPKKKAALKNKLKIEVSKINFTIDVIIVDGCAALYHIHWPKYAKVGDFVDSFVLYTSELFQYAAVYLIFDRYRDYSIKGNGRLKRLGQHLCSHVLTLDSPLPSKEMTLKSTRTKIQLINIICNEFLDHFSESRCQKPLIITGQDDVPTLLIHTIACK